MVMLAYGGYLVVARVFLFSQARFWRAVSMYNTSFLPYIYIYI